MQEKYRLLPLLYRKAFLEKWVLHNENVGTERCHVIRYEDLVYDPREQLKAAIRFISPNLKFDSRAMELSLEKHKVEANWSFDSFVFPETIPKLRQIVSEAWVHTTNIVEGLETRNR